MRIGGHCIRLSTLSRSEVKIKSRTEDFYIELVEDNVESAISLKNYGSWAVITREWCIVKHNLQFLNDNEQFL